MISGNIENLRNPTRNIKGAVEVVNTSTVTKTGNYLEITNLVVGTPFLDPVVETYGTNDFVTIYNHGKNLIPTDYRKYSLYEDKYFTLPKLPVGATMTISHETELGNTQYVYFYEVIDEVKECICRLTTNKVVINSFTFTVKENATYQLFATSQTAISAIVNLQLEVGTERTEYVEYKEPYYIWYNPDSGFFEGTLDVHNGYNLIFASDDREVTLTYNADTGEVITRDDDLISFEYSRIGDNKFFGYGIANKAKITIRDIERKYNFNNEQRIKLILDDIDISPILYIREVSRNENTNQLTITAYDELEAIAKYYTANDIKDKVYTIGEIVDRCASMLGLFISLPELDMFNTTYEGGANFDGTETLRDILNAAAEATQTVYYINSQNELVFKRLDKEGAAALTIDKSQYFTLTSNGDITLAAIGSITELGDNVEATADVTGATQYIRNNPFLELRDDIATILNNAISTIGGLTANQFECKWRGNYLLEPADKIALITKDDSTVNSFIINDIITYDGGLSQVTRWEFAEGDKVPTNPATLGEAIKDTYARVDKANKEIKLVASEVAANTNSIAALELNTNSINAAVESLQQNTATGLESLNNDVATLTSRVEAQITAEDVTIEIQKEIANGVSKVETNTGFTFNDVGLTVTKSNSEIKTTITEDGMSVYKNNNEVLTANNEGVTAIDLKAKTFLVIGDYSRLQNYPNNTRTACFWIGG